MNLLDKNTLERLSNINASPCVSIYFPTHRDSQGDRRQQDQIHLKNALKEVRDKLETSHEEDTIHKLLRPAEQLLEDEEFWKYLSDGMAIFLHENQMEHFTLPLYFDAFTYVDNHLYLLPLLPIFHEDGRFFLMAVSQDQVRFFEGSRHSIADVKIEDLVPLSLEEAVGKDYESNTLQHHSGQGGAERAIFHGQGSGSDHEKKEEIKKYFREINQGLMKMLHDETPPLVLAGVDYLIPIYQEVNTYPHLYAQHLSGNYDETDRLVLHERAWNLLANYFSSEKNQRKENYEKKLAYQLASSKTEEIIPATLANRVDTLFIEKGAQIWGTYEPQSHQVHIDAEHQTDNLDLLNQAAVKAFLTGTKVYTVEKEEMPDNESSVNAIYRY